ncbi:hypothetical protein E1263_02775 [Kribbella antibiotica]|uniref:Uncharacterized protein n=1 Tax=Kribbella antibiotica TaxID=190195 RepID=A0A4R4ZU39_9ACTN|nr:hypothetical protein [Kribbella antibiotica]TDD62658.1 hypothetical protein E1263_02775 [Kribbella antibiotica]
MSAGSELFGSDELYAGALASPVPQRKGLRIAALAGAYTQMLGRLRSEAGQTSVPCMATITHTPPVTIM